MAEDRPPPLPDECPAVFYALDVRRGAGCLIVRARLTHRMPDGMLQQGLGSMNYPDDLTVYVDEPCWLFRMLGDTLTRRVQRAKARVVHAAERRIAQDQRLDAVAEAAC